MDREAITRGVGIVLSGVVSIAMMMDGLVGLLRPQVFALDMASDGWGQETLFPVALLALIGGVLHAIPRTSLLGAIFITGFVGGALAAHLRVTQALILPEVVNVVLGVAAWGGLWLRDARLRQLLPLAQMRRCPDD